MDFNDTPAEAAFRKEAGMSGLSTGLTDLDDLLGGFHRSDLIILAARPGGGKSSLAANIAFSAAKRYRAEVDESGTARVVDGAVVGFFSLEMSSEQLATRILAEASGVSSDRIRKGELSNEEFQRVVEANQ